MTVIYAIMVIATMQTSESIHSHYQVAKFVNKDDCVYFLEQNKMKLTHELIHALEDLQGDKLMDMEFNCVIDKGTPT